MSTDSSTPKESKPSGELSQSIALEEFMTLMTKANQNPDSDPEADDLLGQTVKMLQAFLGLKDLLLDIDAWMESAIQLGESSGEPMNELRAYRASWKAWLAAFPPPMNPPSPPSDVN